MSVAGISSGLSALFSAFSPSTQQNRFQQIQQDFQQIGQDLQSGNLSQAKSTFSSLQQLLPPQQQNGTVPTVATPNSLQSGAPVSQTLAQLGSDLQSGNLSAAQSDFAALKQDSQQQQQQSGVSNHRFHHYHHGGAVQNGPASGQQGGASTLFGELGQELQSGNLSAAQQTYSTMQQDFLQFMGGGGASGGSTASSASLSVSA